jgi:hypothetical protein
MTTDSTEPFDSRDEFHSLLFTLNANFGVGDPLALVWSTKDKGLRRTGMLVCQKQYGMTSKRFCVEVAEDGQSYHIKFLGKHLHKKSDYFEGVAA